MLTYNYYFLLHISIYSNWGTVFALSAVDAMNDPNPSRSCCGLFDIPTKIFPLFICCIFMLLVSPIPSWIIACLLGYIMSSSNILQPSTSILQSCENSIIFSWLTNRGAFIGVDMGSKIIPFNPMAAYNGQEQQSISQQRFTGGGVALGTANDPQQQNRSHVVTIGNYSGSSSGNTAQSTTQQSKPNDVFKQSTGHKLGESTTSNTASLSSSGSSKPGLSKLEQLAKANKSINSSTNDKTTNLTNQPPAAHIQSQSSSHRNSTEEVDHLTGPQTTSYSTLSQIDT